MLSGHAADQNVAAATAHGKYPAAAYQKQVLEAMSAIGQKLTLAVLQPLPITKQFGPEGILVPAPT